MKKKKENKEILLKKIVELELKQPSLALDDNAFSSFIAEKLKITKAKAKKAIEEIKKRKNELSVIDLKAELAKKKKEYAFIKELALKQKNLNAYLGAVNKEAEMLSLEKYAIFSQMQQSEKEEVNNSLEEKKELLFNKLFKD